ncbi:hypothetical protein H4R34_003808 [Dimargaris verticillata]|uniref:Ubiquitin carboxyl-terminal hydrolase n=1 Tax=Dimargaris verticillata TaxID=2761393 RepID=A0A9W8EBP5_9FUNG|nr:hypothetical protein H4R34_003808 [Dimargaris verticillata]
MPVNAPDEAGRPPVEMVLPWCNVDVPSDFWVKARRARRQQIRERQAAYRWLNPGAPATLAIKTASVTRPTEAPVVQIFDFNDIAEATAPLTFGAPESVTSTTAAASLTASTTLTSPSAKPPPAQSWAALVRRNPGPTSDRNKPTATTSAKPAGTHPATTVNGDGSSAEYPGATINGAGPKFSDAASVLRQYQVSYRHTALQPRGLINTGNTCFMNVVLQALLHCPPFYNLLKYISTHVPHRFNSTTVLTDSLVAFANEFQPLAAVDPENSPIDSFKPDVYTTLRSLGRFEGKDGDQQDAHEFLLALLNGVEEELGSAIQQTSTSQTEWKTVGTKSHRKLVVTPNGQPITPINLLFDVDAHWERLKPGEAEPSVERDPSTCLILDISAPSVYSVEDALQQLVKPGFLEMTIDAETGEKAQVPDQKHLSRVPPVLILQFSLFQHSGASGAGKVIKPIAYNLELDMTPYLSSPPLGSRRHQRYPQFTQGSVYDLAAVVCHQGKHLSGGHYTCDVRQSPGQWLRIDDTKVWAIDADKVGSSESAESMPYLLFYVARR